MCNNSEGCSCIAEILNVINVLQQNASCCGDTCLETCDRGFLGCGATTALCNTRPVILYTCSGNGIPWSMPVTRENTDTGTDNGPRSSVFRVEKVDGCCATFRVLTLNTDTTNTTSPYVATNSFFTMNLNCCCVLRCLPDTYVECI